jgi:hypothetical protein
MNRFLSRFFFWMIALSCVQIIAMQSRLSDWWQNLPDSASQKLHDIAEQTQRAYQNWKTSLYDPSPSQMELAETLENEQRQNFYGKPSDRMRQLFIQGIKSEVARQELIDQYNQERKKLRAEYWAQKKPLLQRGVLESFAHHFPKELEFAPIEIPDQEAAYQKRYQDLIEQHRQLDIPYQEASLAMKKKFLSDKQAIESERREMLTRGLLPTVTIGSGLAGAAGALKKAYGLAGLQALRNPAVWTNVLRTGGTTLAIPPTLYYLTKGTPTSKRELLDEQIRYGQFE